MNTIAFDSDLELVDGTYRVIGSSGGLLRMQNQATGEHSTAHISELLPRLVAPPVWTSVSPQALSGLDPLERKEVEGWAAHIEEMATGRRPGFETPRPQYDPELTSSNQRVDAKVQELSARGWPASRASLKRKKTLWQQGGAAALIDKRRNKKVGKLDRADERIIDAIITVAQREVKRSTKTQGCLHDWVDAEIKKRYVEDERPEMPSQATMYRYFNALTEGKHTTGKATTRRSYSNRPKRTYASRRALLPGDEVQTDSTELDILVTVPGLKDPVRPTITVLQDRATRSILAVTVRIVGAKGYDHALLLAQALVPYELRPDRSAHRKLVAARHPEYTLLPDDERRNLERNRPYIFPRRIMTDNGKDFLSTVFTSACAKFGIDITTSAVHTPTDKGIVERNFGSVVSLFIQRFPGYVGDHPVNRGQNVERENLLDLVTLTELLDDWVLNVWQNRKHEGLRDPFEPSITYSPNQAFDAALAFTGSINLPLTGTDFIELMPVKYHKLGTVGIRWKRREYDSDELRPYRGTASNDPKHNHKWEFRYNPYDAVHVWVRSPENTWIQCTWRHAAMLDQPHFGDIARELTTDKRAAVRNDWARQHAALNGVPMPEGEAAPESEPESIPAELLAAFTEFDSFSYEEN